jgi:hypothetical protein
MLSELHPKVQQRISPRQFKLWTVPSIRGRGVTCVIISKKTKSLQREINMRTESSLCLLAARCKIDDREKGPDKAAVECCMETRIA